MAAVPPRRKTRRGRRSEESARVRAAAWAARQEDRRWVERCEAHAAAILREEEGAEEPAAEGGDGVAAVEAVAEAGVATEAEAGAAEAAAPTAAAAAVAAPATVAEGEAEVGEVVEAEVEAEGEAAPARGELRRRTGRADVVLVAAVILFYRYFCGIYHFFDSFGKWYGKTKSGMVKFF